MKRWRTTPRPRHKVPPVAADLPEVRCKPLDRARGWRHSGRGWFASDLGLGNENRAACAGLRACRLAGAGTGDSSWLCDWDLSAGRHRAGVRAGVRRSCRRRRVAGILHPQCLRGWTGQYARDIARGCRTRCRRGMPGAFRGSSGAPKPGLSVEPEPCRGCLALRAPWRCARLPRRRDLRGDLALAGGPDSTRRLWNQLVHLVAGGYARRLCRRTTHVGTGRRAGGCLESPPGKPRAGPAGDPRGGCGRLFPCGCERTAEYRP